MELPTTASILDAMFEEPCEEELNKAAIARYERAAPFMLSNWPEEIRALSFATRLIEVDADDMRAIFSEDWKNAATRIAATLDEAMDWNHHFIRMDSRSPKDASEFLVTPSGRQALSWIMNSERCLDDTVTAMRAGKPIYIALREPRYMHPDGEFRCFAKNGKVLAVSRYFFDKEAQYRPDAGEVMQAATVFYEEHLAKHYSDVVFDLYAPGSPDQVLIELNPYGLSHPCMFKSYDEIERIGGEKI
jgi:hypothetical protein